MADRVAMSQAIQRQIASDAQNRDAIRTVLHRPAVRDLAARMGLNVARAERAVATLDSAELAQLAQPARDAETQLAGGDEIYFSTVTLLLLLILIVLIVK